MTTYTLRDFKDNRTIVLDNGRVIAELWTGGYEAAACMIALANAAQELLAACESAAVLLDAMSPGSRVAAECRAAIAAAKGGTT